MAHQELDTVDVPAPCRVPDGYVAVALYDKVQILNEVLEDIEATMASSRSDHRVEFETRNRIVLV